MRKFADPNVEITFYEFPEPRRELLFDLRDMIYRVSEADERIGDLSEELRWGDPSYITTQTNSGSTVRLGLFGKTKVVLLFHCKTSLVEDFKQKYSNELEYSKNRVIVIDPLSVPPTEILENCIHASLTYKLRD
ncbi:MAG: DUF1801 domain-containing protein [Rhodobacteraceae bacterium]|nr:DUF1801 domain-containing protein [Paracoccaceae bacterium]